MYEENNGFPEWRAEQLIGKGDKEISEKGKVWMRGALIWCVCIGLAYISTKNDLHCVSNLVGPTITCGTEMLGVNYHQHAPTGTHSLAFWSEAGSLIDRAGAAWIPGEGLKVWLKAFFTDGLKEYYLKLPKFP